MENESCVFDNKALKIVFYEMEFVSGDIDLTEKKLKKYEACASSIYEKAVYLDYMGEINRFRFIKYGDKRYFYLSKSYYEKGIATKTEHSEFIKWHL